jgi:hypothetical protein
MIFFRYFRRKIGVFGSKQSFIIKKFDHNIVFEKNANFFRQKLSKIAENCDHNIGPSMHVG